MKLKRFAAGFVAAVMAFAVLGTPLGDILPFVRESVATTAGAETYGDYSYKVLDDGTVEISRYTGNAAVVDIPANINGRRVTSIGDNAFNNYISLTNVTIPDSVTSIGASAFIFCSNLTNITLPKGVTSIGDSAFCNCLSLTSITIPFGVTSIRNSTFYGCSSLTSIAIPKSVTSIGYGAFYYCKSLTSITIPDSVLSIGGYAFSACKTLTSITIPDSVLSIGNSAFSSCEELTRITLPNSVISIGNDTFLGCNKLTSITIPNSVTSIGERVFAGCSSLTAINVAEANKFYSSVDGVLFNKDKTELICYPPSKVDDSYSIPNSVTSIATSAFIFCSNLTNITLPKGMTSIGNSAFCNCLSLTSITIPFGVTSIRNSTFYGCSSLTSITIPNGVTSIGDSAFSGCTSLTSITIPDSVTWIGDRAFEGTALLDKQTTPVKYADSWVVNCDSDVENVIIKSGTKGIANSTFFGCSSLTSITIPNGVTSIGDYTFSNSHNLTSVIISDGVKSIGNSAFEMCSSLTSITLPDSVTSIGESAFLGCESLTSITIPDGVKSIGGYAFESCSSLTSIALSDSMTSIEKYTFNGCSSLTSITLPDSVTSIGEEAFSGCKSLTSITIPDGVKSIGGYAFEDCSSLTSITLPNSVTSIDMHTFDDCTNLSSITIPDSVTSIDGCAFWRCKSLASITIPSSVTRIGNSAFRHCSSLTSITIPSSVTSIDNYAFEDCSSLTSITIPSSVTSIGKSAFEDCNPSFVIRGNTNSEAERYAKQHGFKFEEVKFTHGRADEKLNSVYITWSDVEINELQYPIYNEDEFAKQLKYWVEVDKKEYFVSLQPFLEKYTYKDILSLHVNIPVMTESGEAYSVKGESTVADLMAYILFADSVQDYIEQTLNEVRNRISNSKPYYAFFLDKIKNFNSQYLYFQQSLEGKDAFNDTLQSLLLAKTAMSIIDGLKVTYKSGETKYITFGNSGQTAEDFIKIYKEDIVSTVPLKTYSYFTDLYKATVSESPKYYDELKYYILSGGDTSYLNSYYKDTLKGYSLQIKNVKELFKIAKDTGSLPSETGSLIGLGLDNLSYWADKYNSEHSSEIKSAKEVWSWSNKAKDIIGAVSKGSLVGAFSSAYDITQSYIDEVKKVYQNASNTEAGWYAITYCYLQDNNPKLLEAIIDSETGNAEISIDRLIRYGFPVHSDDIIEKDIAKYYEKHSSLNYTFTPDEEFRFYLWNACNNINTIKNIDCNEYREMLFQYILAELNLESGVTGVQYVADITANDSTLGSVSGTGVYSTKETVTLSAVPYENVSFSGWKNILTGEIESKERNYSINLNDNIKYEAQFAPGEVDAAEQPIISQQPLSRNYRLGDTPVSLTITASNNDSGSLSVKWYKNSSDKNYGGIYISEGFSVIPDLSEVGTYYYYAIVTNTLCSKVGVKTVTTQSSKCTDIAKIVISEPVLSGIEIDSLPNKTEYDKYEYFDNTGMTVKLVYSNGNKVIFNDYCISGFDNSLVGDNVITISAYGYSAKLTLHIKEHIHNYNLWQTTVKPTCTEGGEMKRSCSVCGAEETKTIDALGHDYSEQWTVDEEADCVNDGSKSRHCSRCDAKTDVTVIEAKGHTEVVDKAVAATCTADGYTEGKHCSVCNAVIVAQEKIAATGHKYVETVVEPSYSNRGYTLYECSVCGYSYKDNYEEQLIVPAVTGFASGSQTKSSAVLGWDKVSDADGYAVELYTGGKWNEVFRTSDSSVTSCTVGSLKADSIYSLRIRAFKDTDDGTVYSDYTRLAVKTKLAGVTGLKAQGVTATAVKLDWARNAGATGYIIEQYKGGKWTQIAVTKNNYTLTFTVKGLAECTPYSFRVKAYKNDGGKTNYSDYVTVKASTLLGTVKNAKVTSTTGTWITLGWDRNAGATGYVLEQYKGGRWTEIAVTKNNTTLKFTVKGLRNDTTYSFRIKAYKTVGDTTTYGSYVRIVGTTDIPNVAKFTGSAVSASAVKLDWCKNDKATGYVIEQYKGGRWTEIKAVDNDITEITVEGLAKGTAYTFRIKSVKTVDGADKSSEYASVKVKTAE